ncbi:hypothetical protein MKX03_001249 [Papaver bracteatum]|nr:hypothetical protein MKX03_001249 [Papaver bracteatum]
MEANARMSDPVHGVASFAETLSQKLDLLLSELDLFNQQIQFHRQRSKFCQNSFDGF